MCVGGCGYIEYLNCVGIKWKETTFKLYYVLQILSPSNKQLRHINPRHTCRNYYFLHQSLSVSQSTWYWVINIHWYLWWLLSFDAGTHKCPTLLCTAMTNNDLSVCGYSFSSVSFTVAAGLHFLGEFWLTEHIEYDERNHYDWHAWEKTKKKESPVSMSLRYPWCHTFSPNLAVCP